MTRGGLPSENLNTGDGYSARSAETAKGDTGSKDWVWQSQRLRTKLSVVLSALVVIMRVPIAILVFAVHVLIILAFLRWIGMAEYHWPWDNKPAAQTGPRIEASHLAHELKLDSHHPEWTSTSLIVQTGETLRFRATGTFVWDPSTKEPVVGPDGASWTPAQASNPGDFQLPSARIASLIGRVGNWVFPIGASLSVQARATGELLLGINERWVSGAWDDNQGILQVLVQVATQPPGETAVNTAGGAAQQSSNFTFEVDSTRGWQPTSLAVTAGQQVTLSAVGKWSVDARNFSFVGPQGYTPQEDARIYQGCKVDPSQPYGVLLVRFGDDHGFQVVGAAGTLTAHYSGPVSFRINDADSCLGDNRGSVKVTATIQAPQPSPTESLGGAPQAQYELGNNNAPTTPQGQYRLAANYEWGYGGVKQDYQQAMYWYRKAADQGYADAQFKLGWFYESGLGVGKDYGQARVWYQKAADQGDEDAQAALYRVARKATPSVPLTPTTETNSNAPTTPAAPSALTATPPPAEAEPGREASVVSRTFMNPSYHGYRLDWCRIFENDCGAPAAVAFCKEQGFSGSGPFQFQPNLGVPTMTIEQNRICDPHVHRCDSFASITCQASPGRQASATPIGCYVDRGADAGTAGRDLHGVFAQLGDMTVEKCVTSCASKGFKFAGAQYGSQCFCGMTYGKYGTSNACSMPCAGNPDEICGGFWANSVYSIHPKGRGSRKRGLQRADDPAAPSALAKACAKDIKSLCAHVRPGGGALTACVKDHFSDLSTECQIAIVKAAAVGRACKADMTKFCADVKPGKGSKAECLKSHAADLSDSCKEAMAQADAGGGAP